MANTIDNAISTIRFTIFMITSKINFSRWIQLFVSTKKKPYCKAFEFIVFARL